MRQVGKRPCYDHLLAEQDTTWRMWFVREPSDHYIKNHLPSRWDTTRRVQLVNGSVRNKSRTTHKLHRTGLRGYSS